MPFGEFKTIFIKGLPLMLNELFWAAGMTTVTQWSSMVGSRADSPSKCPMPPPYPHGRPSMHTFRRTYGYRRREEEEHMRGDY